MTRLVDEVRSIQNPALGATILWRFVCGYCPPSSTAGVPLPLCFLVLPILFHARSAEEVAGTLTGSGLRKFEEKFKSDADLLLAIQPRMLAMRALSMRSLQIALGTGLVELDPSLATLRPSSDVSMPSESKRIVKLMKSAEKLGTWCSGMSLFEIAGLLKVEF